MEEDMMVVSDGNGIYTRTTLKNSRSSTKTNKCQSKVLPVVAGCLVIVFLTVLVAVTIVKTTSYRTQFTTAMDNKKDLESITLRVLFSTDYDPDSEVKSWNVKNINSLSDKLNTKLNEGQIRILDVLFDDRNLIEGLICPNALSGMALQWHIVTFYSPQCAAQNKDICKEEFQKQLKNKIDRVLSGPITIEYDENLFKTINIKICSVTEVTEEPRRKIINKQASVPMRRKKPKAVTYPMLAATAQYPRNDPIDYIAPNIPSQNPSCSKNIGRITLVQMAGELESRIQDDTRIYTASTEDYYQRYRTVSVYENMVYQLQVQLDCNQQIGRDSTQNVCELAQDVHVWIDFNNNDYDDGESRILHRTNSNGRIIGNMYDLEVYIPVVDERNTMSGPHRMRLTIVPSEEYKRSCGDSSYKETRDYTVIIASRKRAVVEPVPSNIIYDNGICSLNSGKISLVLMAGQKGTEIRDDKPTGWTLDNYQDQHHLAVTLFENTIYLIRIQLDCNWQIDKELFEKGCNLAQDVNVWIDLNNDGRFDDSEVGAPYRWPVTSYLPEGIYDLQIRVPSLSSEYIRSGRHRMRLTVMSSDYYRRVCGRTDHNETREYFVNIISKTDNSVPTEVASVDSRLLQNIVCSPQVSKILRIYMPGEHRTQIRDEVSERNLWNNAYHTQQPIVLYQDHIYLLRIQLDCSRQWSDHQSSEYNCQLIYHVNAWIDLNDDGFFQQSENVSPYRWPLNSYTPQGNYDLQIYTPVIDTRITKHGPHRMQVEVTMSEYYNNKCNDNDYKEIRNYTVYIVPYRTQAVDVGVPYVQLADGVCSQPNGKIVLVIMAGEQGTQIRDNIPTNIVLRESQNRHHQAVSLYESATYRLRVQLSCRQHSDGSWTDINCNLAQDVNVLIDFNNDGTFDESESRVIRRWPLHSSIPLGIYDFEIDIPSFDERRTRSGSYRLRIVVKSSDEYNQKCGRSNHHEEREYTINIIPRPTYQEFSRGLALCSPGNLVCTRGNNGIASVELVAEQNTQIRDNIKQCSSSNNYNDQSNLIVYVFENTGYTMYIRLFCVQDEETLSNGFDCNSNPQFGVWIDFNDDGNFDSNTEQVLSGYGYLDDERTSEFRLNVAIPQISSGYYSNSPHRMRVLLITNQQALQPCYNSGYGEARDYSVQIVPRS